VKKLFKLLWLAFHVLGHFLIRVSQVIVIPLFGFKLDKMTKDWALNSFQLGELVEVIPGVLEWRLLFNKGAAFSFFSGYHQVLGWLGLVFAIGAMIYVFMQRGKLSWLKEKGLLLLAAGSLGNMLDRFRLGYVIDFIDFVILPGDFPVCNVADLLISLGVVCWGIDLYRQERSSTASNI